MHEPMMGLWGLTGYVLMVALLAVGLVAVVLWVKSWLEQGRPGSAPRQTDSALEILKKRYARGEISNENSKRSANIFFALTTCRCVWHEVDHIRGPVAVVQELVERPWMGAVSTRR